MRIPVYAARYPMRNGKREERFIDLVPELYGFYKFKEALMRKARDLKILLETQTP